ncbi:MAG TPA: hypothetical protein VGZ47_02990 [Gemmataceae bacterium]|jgi:hypothetical protein|nr:hypothetical protein [Gemmataceae bacterium]
MSHELFYTSVAAGLQPGDHGFCVVAQTRGLPSDLLAKLKTFSDYRELFPPGDPQASQNPVRYSHLRIKLGSRRYQVLTRACFAGRDYSQRTNKFVHHVVLEGSELTPGGPAWALQQPGFMETGFDGKPRYLEYGRSLPDDEPTAAPCRAWEMETGDAGWAGILAGAITPDRPAFLIYNLGQEPLTLIGEALALLPPERRWDVTFSTYFCGLPPDVWCQWRCVIEGTDEARVAQGTPGALILKLSTEQGSAPPTELVQAARTGQRVAMPAPAKKVPVAAGSYSPSPVTSARALAGGNSPPRSRRLEPVDLADGDWREQPAEKPVMEQPRSRTTASLMWLMAGLVLGTLFVTAAVLLVELTTGQGLLGKSSSEKAALADAQRLKEEKEAAESAERAAQNIIRAADERNLRLERLLEEARKKPGPEKHTPAPANVGRWGWAPQLIQGSREPEVLQKQLHEAWRQLAEANKQIERLKAKNKEPENKPAKNGGPATPKDDSNTSQSKEPDKKKEPIKPTPPTDADKEKAASQKLETAKMKHSSGDKDKAIELLKDLLDKYSGTKAAAEAEKLLAIWMKE